MENILEEKERIDDLQYHGLKIIQREDGFCFGMDSILLSDFAKDIKPKSKVLDLGTGTGILGILLCGKTELEKIIGIEIQQEMAEMAQKSIFLNHLENRFEIRQMDIKNLKEIFPKESFDAIVTNPPYKKQETGLQNQNILKQIARHEVCATLEDFICASFQMLKDRGTLYMVHRPERLADLVTILRKYKLEPKKMTFVYPRKDKACNLVLIKAIKNARSELKITPPIIVYETEGEYTRQILEIYDQKEGE